MDGKSGEDMELRHVVIALGPEWEDGARKLERQLSEEGVCCVCFGDGQAAGRRNEELTNTGAVRSAAGEAGAIRPGNFSASDTVVITDDRTLAAALARRGFVCIGCAGREGGFFEGAALVTDVPEALDARALEEHLLRETGRPVTIAVTDRLIIREIAERDIPGLHRIGRQDGTRRAMEDADGDCFEPERLSAYIRHAYRFYGYGLWSVLLHDGTLVGCCGFADFVKDRDAWEESCAQEAQAGKNEKDKKDDKDGTALCLELQYVVAEEYRRQGYGEEMCRAALEYARGRLQADQIWIRVKTDNRGSRALAERLEFRRIRTDGSRTEFYRLG